MPRQGKAKHKHHKTKRDKKGSRKQPGLAAPLLADGGGTSTSAVVTEEMKEGIEAMLDTLPHRERNVLRMRYGLDADGRSMSLMDISSAYGVTRERIRQIELKALRKLRHPRTKQVLRGYLESVAPEHATATAAAMEASRREAKG